MGQLGVAVAVFHVLEPFEVQGQYLREALHPQPLGGLLLAAALFTVVLVFCTKCLGRGEHP